MKRLRTYHTYLDDALRALYRKQLDGGGDVGRTTLQDVLVRIRAAEDRVLAAVAEYAEYLRLKNLPLFADQK